MKRKTKIIAAIMSVIMFVTSLPLMAFANPIDFGYRRL